MVKKVKKISSKDIILLSALLASIFTLGFTVYAVVSLHTNLQSLIASHTEAGQLSAHFSQLANTGFTITQQTNTYKIAPSTFREWFEPYARAFTGTREFRPNKAHMQEFLLTLATQINQPSINATFTFVDDHIVEKTKSRPGQELDAEASINNILRAISKDEAAAPLVIRDIPPALSLTSLAHLGITTLIGEGTSDFKGSPQARIHNIRTGATLFNNMLIGIGEEFSFNQRLGIVDASTGYLPELVIKQDKIIPEYGGGLCQVSTTMFRAAMTSGLPIIERHSHSLPVHYYNPQGYDAAIYPGVYDLRFKNDTSTELLVQTKVENNKLTFDIFGTNDGRKVALGLPRIYDQQPDGSLKAVLGRTVTYADGKEDKQSFFSSYKSPASFTVIKNPLE